MSKYKIIEELADLEHEQWIHWTKYMIENFSYENREKWLKQIETKYEDLSEKEKKSDRVWARKVFKIFKDAGFNKNKNNNSKKEKEISDIVRERFVKFKKREKQLTKEFNDAGFNKNE